MTKYEVTEGDYNDVFSRTEMEFKDWIEAEKYAYSVFRPIYEPQIQDIGTDCICLAIYYPVTDDNGNEIGYDHPDWDKLNEEQELRIEYYIEIREIEDQEIQQKEYTSYEKQEILNSENWIDE